jgi:hypothetical protein
MEEKISMDSSDTAQLLDAHAATKKFYHKLFFSPKRFLLILILFVIKRLILMCAHQTTSPMLEEMR